MDLAEELMAIPSVSHHEGPLADRVQRLLEGCSDLAVTRTGDNVVARTQRGAPTRVVIAGHLDTVPPADNATPRRQKSALWGVGAADMKGSLAVMLTLATTVVRPAVDVTWCFYAREEVAREHSGLAELWAADPHLLAADAAVLCEPTEVRVEAGCQGTMRAEVHLRGVRAHTARPFTGRNAIHRLGSLLTAVASWEPRRVTLEGCEYTEQLQAVEVTGGVAGNVVPDLATVVLNYRFAPDRDAASAAEFLRSLLGDHLEEGDEFEVVEVGEGAPPALAQPLIERLVARSGHPPRAKVGWTDVAFFWSHGIPAANCGAGDPLLAHHPQEHVDEDSLVALAEVLADLLEGAALPAERPSLRDGAAR